MNTPININFSKRVIYETSQSKWSPGPIIGADQILFEREALESGRVTRLVRYAPGTFSKIPLHTFGEEIFVVSGVYLDERGSHGPWTYLRNPPGSLFSSGSESGCVLFVKHGQFHPGDTTSVVIDTKKEPWRQGHGGLTVMPLHTFNTESTALVKWPSGEKFFPHRHWGGEEIFVLSGVFMDEFASYPMGTWIRRPHLSSHHPFVEQETVILVKTGHLG